MDFFFILSRSSAQSLRQDLHTNKGEKGENCIYIIAVVNRQKLVNYFPLSIAFARLRSRHALVLGSGARDQLPSHPPSPSLIGSRDPLAPEAESESRASLLSLSCKSTWAAHAARTQAGTRETAAWREEGERQEEGGGRQFVAMGSAKDVRKQATDDEMTTKSWKRIQCSCTGDCEWKDGWHCVDSCVSGCLGAEARTAASQGVGGHDGSEERIVEVEACAQA